MEFSAADSVEPGESAPPPGGSGSFASLSSIVADATYRRFLIPPLQRGPVWGLSDQRRLLGSVLAGRPIGALLTVERIIGIDGSDAVPLGMRVGIDRRALPPSRYVTKILEESGASEASRRRLSEVLAQHGIEIDHLERDDFESFMAHRERWYDESIRDLGDSLCA